MKRLIMVVAGAVLATAAQAYNEVQLTWKNSTGGDVTDVANWSGVPTGVTDISYTPEAEYYGLFSGVGSKTLSLTLSKDFFFNRYYLQSTGTKYDFNLGGHTLKLRGAATGQIFYHNAYLNQHMTIRNGTFQFSTKTSTGERSEMMIAGDGNVLTFLGADTEPMIITGRLAVAKMSYSGMMVWTNVISTMCQVQGSGRVILTGDKTKIRQVCDGYMGIIGDSNCKLSLENKAYAEVINTSGNQKADMLVGGSGGGRNEFVVTGVDTYLMVTNKDHSASNQGGASIVCGYQSNGNRFHVTDPATVKCSSKLMIGNPLSDTSRGSACNNFIRIDSNAVVTASEILVGQRANRDNYTYKEPMPSFVSNVCVIADSARVTLNNTGFKVGTEFTVS